MNTTRFDAIASDAPPVNTRTGSGFGDANANVTFDGVDDINGHAAWTAGNGWTVLYNSELSTWTTQADNNPGNAAPEYYRTVDTSELGEYVEFLGTPPGGSIANP
jgi:hypothetical protein